MTSYTHEKYEYQKSLIDNSGVIHLNDLVNYL